MPPRNDPQRAVVEIKNKLVGKVLILGVGNVLKQDDGIGPHFVRKLETRNPCPSGRRAKSESNIELLDCGVAPENYTGKIKQIKPDTLIIVDAIDFGEKPGNIRVFLAEEISVQSLSTHNVSLKTFVGFLKQDLPDLNVLVVGIQPKVANLGEGLSPEVEKAVDELCMNFI